MSAKQSLLPKSNLRNILSHHHQKYKHECLKTSQMELDAFDGLMESHPLHISQHHHQQNSALPKAGIS